MAFLFSSQQSRARPRLCHYRVDTILTGGTWQHVQASRMKRLAIIKGRVSAASYAPLWRMNLPIQTKSHGGLCSFSPFKRVPFSPSVELCRGLDFGIWARESYMHR
jgi:hypothetical protein